MPCTHRARGRRITAVGTGGDVSRARDLRMNVLFQPVAIASRRIFPTREARTHMSGCRALGKTTVGRISSIYPMREPLQHLFGGAWVNSFIHRVAEKKRSRKLKRVRYCNMGSSWKIPTPEQPPLGEGFLFAVSQILFGVST